MPPKPTAMQNVLLVQETLVSWLLSLPTVGLGTTDQELPFHCSMRVWRELESPV